MHLFLKPNVPEHFLPDGPEEAKRFRNEIWQMNPSIPKWVDVNSEELDQFFTRPEIAEHCYLKMVDVMQKNSYPLNDCVYIEPAVGAGAFYDLFPHNRRIGLDVLPLREEFVLADFLSWEPPDGRARYVVMGNPPFGFRSWLALAFVNHASLFADYVGMVLPMAFQSEGKGSPNPRVQRLQLVHSEILPRNSFVLPCGSDAKINALWQIWQKGSRVIEKPPSCDDWLELFTIQKTKDRFCGYERKDEADWFLQRTFFEQQPTLVKDLDTIRYGCGYGIIVKRDHKDITDILSNVDWSDYSNLAAHNCHHISMYHIRKVLTDAGYVDS